jgi:hypothetical protein
LQQQFQKEKKVYLHILNTGVRGKKIEEKKNPHLALIRTEQRSKTLDPRLGFIHLETAFYKP